MLYITCVLYVDFLYKLWPEMFSIQEEFREILSYILATPFKVSDIFVQTLKIF